MSPSLILAERLCARMCHDISSPLSALSGVLDLMRRAPTHGEAAEIAEQAVRAAQDRLRLFRAAWCESDRNIETSDIIALTEGLHVTRRVVMDMHGLSGSFPPDTGRLILNFLLVAVESLAGSGHVTVLGSAQSGVTIRIAGAHAHWPASLARYLTTPGEAWAELQTHEVLAPLAAIIADASDNAVTLKMGRAKFQSRRPGTNDGSPDRIRPVRRDRDVAVLHGRRSQPLVWPGVRTCMRCRLCIRIFTGGLAIRACGRRVGRCGAAPLVETVGDVWVRETAPT
jgi:histidine phosphotransferase ChpT